MIIKTAWGGRSLGGDFRPPSAVANRGGEIGPFDQNGVISDIRSEFGKPNLPFVMASTGMATGGTAENPPCTGYGTVEKAQLWMAGVANPTTVLSADTRPFWRDASVSPSATGQGFHWNRNAGSDFLIGKALGDDIVDLLTP